MNESLAESIIHRTHRICGRRLHPLTLWHVWLLDFCRSPYVGATDGGTLADLALAIEICSRPPSYPGAPLPSFSIFHSPFSLSDLRPSKPLLASIVRRGKDAVSAAFSCYLADHISMPKCWSESGGRAVRSDICLYSVAVLMRHGRKSEPEAWATGFGYARHLVLALAEAGGNEVPIISREEEEALAEAGYQP